MEIKLINNIKCPLCNYEAFSYEALKDHIYGDKISRHFSTVCEALPKPTSKASQLARLKAWAEIDKNRDKYKVECTGCHKTFTRFSKQTKLHVFKCKKTKLTDDQKTTYTIYDDTKKKKKKKEYSTNINCTWIWKIEALWHSWTKYNDECEASYEYGPEKNVKKGILINIPHIKNNGIVGMQRIFPYDWEFSPQLEIAYKRGGKEGFMALSKAIEAEFDRLQQICLYSKNIKLRKHYIFNIIIGVWDAGNHFFWKHNNWCLDIKLFRYHLLTNEQERIRYQQLITGKKIKLKEKEVAAMIVLTIEYRKKQALDNLQNKVHIWRQDTNEKYKTHIQQSQHNADLKRRHIIPAQ